MNSVSHLLLTFLSSSFIILFICFPSSSFASAQSPSAIGGKIASFFRKKPPQPIKPIDPSKMSVPELFETLSSLPASKFDKIADQLISETFGLGSILPPPAHFEDVHMAQSRPNAILSAPPLPLRHPFDPSVSGFGPHSFRSLVFPVFVAKESVVHPSLQSPPRSGDARRPSPPLSTPHSHPLSHPHPPHHSPHPAVAASVSSSSLPSHPDIPKEARVARIPLSKTYPILDVSSSNDSPRVFHAPHDPAQVLHIFSQAFASDNHSNTRIAAAGTETVAKVTLTPEMAQLAAAASNVRTSPAFPVFVKAELVQSNLSKLNIR